MLKSQQIEQRANAKNQRSPYAAINSSGKRISDYVSIR